MDRFRYEKVRAAPSFADPEPIVYRPVIEIGVHGFEKDWSVSGVLDTGAVETVLPAWLWDQGYIDPLHVIGEVGTLIAAIGEEMFVRYGTVDLSVKLQGRVHRWTAKVAFSPDRDDALLGDAGFLRYFVVTFNRPRFFTTLRLGAMLPPRFLPRR